MEISKLILNQILNIEALFKILKLKIFKILWFFWFDIYGIFSE